MFEPVRPLPLRTTTRLKQLEAWALVMTSQGLRPLIEYRDGVFELRALPEERAEALNELALHDAEERETKRARRADAAKNIRPVFRYAYVASALSMLALLAFFAVTGPRALGSTWFTAGASNAERVLQGEWWRTVTALTLHADTGHVVSNVGIGVFVVGAVMRTEGVGLGSLLVLGAGTLGNLVNAWAHQAHHNSVGFSTAVFGAIGVLGGLAYMQVSQQRHKLRPAWTALGGTLALLAMLGASERSDLFAHLFGAAAGLVLGLASARLKWRPSTWAGQWLLSLLTAGLVMVSWALALGHV